MRSKFCRTVSIVTLASILFAAVVIAAGPEEGTASGKLTVDGKTTPLTHAYARAQKGFFDKTKVDILVILSDVAISEEALLDEFARIKMAAEGKLHAVEVVLNDEKQAVSGGLLHDAFKETQGYVSVTGIHAFQAKIFDTKMVEGKLSTEKTGEFMNKKFEYSATFRAAVWHRPPPTASGAAAAQTALGKAALAFLKAAQSGDKAVLRALMTADSARALDGTGGRDMLDMLKLLTPNPATAKIETVDIQGNSAEVVIVEESKDSSTTTKFTFVLEEGQWKFSGGA